MRELFKFFATLHIFLG